MKLVKLSPTDELFNKATHKAIINAADVAALGTGVTASLQIYPAVGNFPAGTRISNTGFKLIKAFDYSDVTMISLGLSVGITGTPAKFMASTETGEDSTEVPYFIALPSGQPFDFNSPDFLIATVTCGGGASPKLSNATIGEVHIYFSATTPSDAMSGVRGTL